MPEAKKKLGSLSRDEVSTVKKLLNKAREDGQVEKRFDINLAEGEIAERELRELFTGGVKIEVKRDFYVSKSGNIAVEESYRGKDSGIRTTEADVWVFVLDGPEFDGEVKILISTERLRCLVQEVKSYVRGGDSKRSQMRLMPVEWLLKRASEMTCEEENKVVGNSRNKKTGKQKSPGKKSVKRDSAVRSKTKTRGATTRNLQSTS